jgi:hypothetical protein
VGRPPAGALLVLCVGGGASFCMRDILILTEIWAQDKYFGRQFAWLKYEACYIL